MGTAATLRALGRLAVRVLSFPLERGLPPPRADQRADAIVVLGAPLRPDGSLPPVTHERAEAGLALWRRERAAVLCLVGGHCPPGYETTAAEVEGVALWFRRQGVPEAALRVDRASRSTRENARCAAAVLLPEGRARVWLVTQAFHARRALYLFRRAGFEPAAWALRGGVTDDDPRWKLRQVLREYGAWGLLAARAVGGKMGRELRST